MSRSPGSPSAGRRALAATAVTAVGLLCLAPGAAGAAAPAAAAKSGPLTVAYVEVNSNDLANVGRYELEDGSNAFDVAIIFAANINHDGEGAYLHLNEQVTQTLEDADTQIRPLQAKGIKVTLSLLGNHSAAGFANFPTPAAAEEFADEVAEVVRTYDLDGVDIDDEWVTYGSGSTPAAVPDSAAWLVEALDEKLPEDSLITLYDIGETAEQLQEASPDVLDRLDYFWNPYYGQYNVPQFPGVQKDRLGAAAVDFSQTSAARAAELATRTTEDDYGVFVTYNLQAGDHSAYASAFTQPLYGQDTVLVPTFADVSREAMFFAEIEWLAESRISTGWERPDGMREFRPVTPIARDAMAAFLYREAGRPAFTAPAVSPFTDVAPGDPFYTEIAWLDHEKISTGWANGDGTASFRPLQPIARDAMAAFLHRAAGSPTFDLPETSPFTDVAPGDQFYAEISWAAGTGIAVGWVGNDGTRLYQPLNPINRDAMAAFLHRFHHDLD